MAPQEPQTLAARVEIPSPCVSPGDELRYVVINDGDVPIMLGGGYAFDRWVNDEWKPVPMRMWVAAWGRRLEPGANTELSLSVREGLSPGRYLLRKRLDPDRDPHRGYEWVAKANITPIESTAEFEVRPG